MVFKFVSRVANVLLESTVTVLIWSAAAIERISRGFDFGDCHCQGVIPHPCGSLRCIHR